MDIIHQIQELYSTLRQVLCASMAISAVFELCIGLPDLGKARLKLAVPGLDRCKLLFEGLSHLLELASQ